MSFIFVYRLQVCDVGTSVTHVSLGNKTCMAFHNRGRMRIRELGLMTITLTNNMTSLGRCLEFGCSWLLFLFAASLDDWFCLGRRETGSAGTHYPSIAITQVKHTDHPPLTGTFSFHPPDIVEAEDCSPFFIVPVPAVKSLISQRTLFGKMPRGSI